MTLSSTIEESSLKRVTIEVGKSYTNTYWTVQKQPRNNSLVQYYRG